MLWRQNPQASAEIFREIQSSTAWIKCPGEPYLDLVDLEKEYTCQKELLVVNWAHIHNQSLEAGVYQGPLTHTAF